MTETYQPVGKSAAGIEASSNKAWWESNPMTYDWEGSLKLEKYSSAWYDEIDRRFFASAYYAQNPGEPPFHRFMPESLVRGARALEIGCGMGSHAELLTRRGARLTVIDQTDFAINATTRRLAVRGLPSDVRQMDAENLAFPDKEFDLVWSWGVIHHSHSTEKVVGHIARILKPGGKFRFMVYYRPSLVYWLHCGLIRGVLLGQLLRKTVNQIYVDSTDGFYARVFNKAELHTLLDADFRDIEFHIVGLKGELYPIPRTGFKVALENATPDTLASAILGRWGSMIQIEAIRR